jgi:putative ABC transport system permease protein
MTTPLAWKNLFHNKTRTAVAVLGIIFAVVLMFMQLGFLGTVRLTSAMIYEAMDFDLLLRSPMYLQLSDPKTFPEQRLNRVASIPGVASVTPLYMSISTWRHPADGGKQGALLMGMRPGTSPFLVERCHGELHALATAQDVLIDRKSKPEFGPQNNKQFGDEDLGRLTEINGRQVCIRGCFELGTGFAANGAVLMTERGYRRVVPTLGANRLSLGLVNFDQDMPPEHFLATVQRVQDSMTSFQDVDAMTRKEALDFENNFWLFDKSIGVMFMLGVVVAVIVGFAIVYQVLSLDIARNLGEYATLKAMGYGNRFITSVVIFQAIFLAGLGYLLGIITSFGLYAVTEWGAQVPIRMSRSSVTIVSVATLGMCLGSALVAVRKAYRADPADLF